MMEVQKYLKKYGLEKLKEEFSIIVTDYDDLVVLNYSQIESPRFDPICDECRSLILEKNTWKVLARSFDRFYNYNENPNDKDFPIIKAKIQNKLDGCCDGSTLLTTKKGKKTIQEICESKEEIEVLAYDCNLKKEVWTKVLAFSIKRNNNDWYEIEMEDGKILRLTGSHYVWMQELKCYRQVKDLKEKDDLLNISSRISFYFSRKIRYNKFF